MCVCGGGGGADLQAGGLIGREIQYYSKVSIYVNQVNLKPVYQTTIFIFLPRETKVEFSNRINI